MPKQAVAEQAVEIPHNLFLTYTNCVFFGLLKFQHTHTHTHMKHTRTHTHEHVNKHNLEGVRSVCETDVNFSSLLTDSSLASIYLSLSHSFSLSYKGD